MEHKILVDSCVDYNDAVFSSQHKIGRVPFRVTIDGEEYIDQRTEVTDQLEKRNFLARVIHTSCPSPGDFYAAMEQVKDAFVVTISSGLSGSYNAAMAAKEMIKQQDPLRHIHIFDCKSASAGENLVTLKIQQLIADKVPTAQIIETTNHYIEKMKTFFCLDSLDTLVSNGRVSIAKKLTCKALGIFPIMGDDGNGKIELKAVTRGKKNTIGKLVDLIDESGQDFADRILAITHINALERANELKRVIQERLNFREVLVFEGGGLSSVYASKGGIIVAY